MTEPIIDIVKNLENVIRVTDEVQTHTCVHNCNMLTMLNIRLKSDFERPKRGMRSDNLFGYARRRRSTNRASIPVAVVPWSHVYLSGMANVLKSIGISSFPNLQVSVIIYIQKKKIIVKIEHTWKAARIVMKRSLPNWLWSLVALWPGQLAHSIQTWSRRLHSMMNPRLRLDHGLENSQSSLQEILLTAACIKYKPKRAFMLVLWLIHTFVSP